MSKLCNLCKKNIIIQSINPFVINTSKSRVHKSARASNQRLINLSIIVSTISFVSDVNSIHQSFRNQPFEIVNFNILDHVNPLLVVFECFNTTNLGRWTGPSAGWTLLCRSSSEALSNLLLNFPYRPVTARSCLCLSCCVLVPRVARPHTFRKNIFDVLFWRHSD